MGWRDYMDDGSQFKPYAVPKTQPNETGWRAYMPKPEYQSAPDKYRQNEMPNQNATFLGGLGQAGVTGTGNLKDNMVWMNEDAQITGKRNLAETLTRVSDGNASLGDYVNAGKNALLDFRILLNPRSVAGELSQQVQAHQAEQQQRAQAIDARNNALQAATPHYDNRLANWGYGGLQSFVQNAPAMAVSMAARNPAPMLGYGSASTGTGKYVEARRGGYNPTQATAIGGAHGAIEGLTEMIPAHKLMGDIGKSTAGKILKDQILSDAPGEIIAGVSQNAVDTQTGLGGQNKGDWRSYLQQLPDTVGQAAVGSIVGSGANAAIVGGVNRFSGVGRSQPAQVAQAKTSSAKGMFDKYAPQNPQQKSANLSQAIAQAGQVANHIQPTKTRPSIRAGVNGWSGNVSQTLAGNIQQAAQRHGVNPNLMTVMTWIESRGDANAVSPTGARGIGQFIGDTAERYGLKGKGFDNRHNEAQSVDAMARYVRDIQKSTGSTEPYIVYMGYQQGEGGAAEIVRAAREGRDVSPKIRENMDVNGGKGKTPAQFLEMWKQKWAQAEQKVLGGASSSVAINEQPSGMNHMPIDDNSAQLQAMQDAQDALDAQTQSMREAQDQMEYAAYQQEKQSKALRGADTEVEVSGKYEPSEWQIQEADDLGATMDKADNQFRDRSRLASEQQIDDIANNLDHRKLTDSPMMDYGAPTLAQDERTVIGGNGRIAAIKRAYANGKADQYRIHLTENAGRYGFTPEQVQQFQNPVLVRRFKNAVDVQHAAIASNEGGGLTMSALEQSKVDASRLPPLSSFHIPDDGQINTAANREAIRTFVGAFPKNHRASLVDANGMLSQQGLSRLKNAMLYQAYGDSPTLSRLVESNDMESRNVGNAMMQSAGAVADAKNDIAQGDLHDLDISQDIMQAADILEQIKAEGGTIRAYLAQRNMFDEHMTPVSRRLLRFLDKNIRSAKKIRDLVNAYYDAVRAVGSPKQADMLGGDTVPSREQLMEKAINDAESGQTDEPNLFEPEPNREATAGHERSAGASVDESGQKSEAGAGDGRSVEQDGEQRQAVNDGLQFSRKAKSVDVPKGSFDQTAAKYGGQAAYEHAKSNGETELNYRQWVQVRTPEFKAWFGDWENDPENASQVINPKTGEPLVVYHGSPSDFTIFDYDKMGSTGTSSGQGFYFTTAQDYAEAYSRNGGNVIASFLNIRKPLSPRKRTLTKVHTKRLLAGVDKAQMEDGEHYFLSEFGDVASDGYAKVLDYATQTEYSYADSDVRLVGGIINAAGSTEDVYGVLDKMFGGTGVVSPQGDGSTHYVVGLPNQIKSATGNSGAFDAGNDDIRYSRRVDNSKSAYESAKTAGETELTFHQWQQVRTPEFKKWFGDWENDPDNASKVVNPRTGEPLAMYHGTSHSQDGNAFTRFDTYGSNYGLMGQGSYFTDNAGVASSYTKKGRGNSPSVYSVFLNIRNPIDMDAQADAQAWADAYPDAADYHDGGSTNESWFRAMEEALQADGVYAADGAEQVAAAVADMGYDGVSHIGGGRVASDGVKHRVYIAHEPNQIKSATGNSGAFDAKNDDIRFSRSASNQGYLDGEEYTPKTEALTQDERDTIISIYNRYARGEKLNKTGQIEDSFDIFAKSKAFQKIAQNEGYTIVDRYDNGKYLTLTKGDILINARISDHSNVNHSIHFKENEINIAPDDGYAFDTFESALYKLRHASVDEDGDLFIGGEEPLRFSRSAETQKTSVRSIQKAIHNLLMFKGNEPLGQQLPNVRVVQSDLSVGSDVQAMYNSKTKQITLIANNIPAGQELSVFLHEVFHKRGRELMGERYAQLKGLIEQWANHSEGSIERQVYDAAKRRADESGETGQRYDDELIAYSIEEAVNRGIEPKRGDLERTGVRGFVARAMQLFNQVLGKVVGKPISLTPRDLVAAAHAAAMLEAKQKDNVASIREGKQFSKQTKGFENVPEASIQHEEGLFKRATYGWNKRDQSGEWTLGRRAFDSLIVPMSKKIGLMSNAPAEFKSVWKDFVAENTKAQRAAKDIHDQGKPIEQFERELLSDILENEVAAGINPPDELAAIAQDMRRLLSQQTDDLVALGMLNTESAERWRDTYLPRFYKKQADLFGGHIKPMFASYRAARKMGLDGSHIKGRGIFKSIPKGTEARYEAMGLEVRGQDKNGQPVVWRDFTKDDRRDMGEMRDGIARFTAGYLQTQGDIAKARLYNRIAMNEELASKTHKEGWKPVSDAKIADTGLNRYGALNGMYVHPDVFDHLNSQLSLTERNALFNLYRRALGYWKVTKTVYNPVAHFNNMVSNVHMLWLAGGNPLTLIRGARDMLNKRGYYQEAIDAGLIGDGVDSAAIKDMFGGLQNHSERGAIMTFLAKKAVDWHVGKPIAKLGDFAQKAYRVEDEVFKLALYTQQRDRGLSVSEAREYAEQFFFDYSDVGKAVRFARDSSLLPFVSYTAKAAPAIARIALTRPHRLLGLTAAYWGLNALGYAMSGSDEDKERENMPEFRKGYSIFGIPKQLRLPWNDEGKPAYIDITRILPLGDFADINNQQGGTPIPNWLMPNGPIVGAASVFLFNRDPFTGEDFKKSYETTSDKAGDYAKWLMAQWLPSSIGVPFSYHTNKLMDGLKSQFEGTAFSDALEYMGYTGRRRNGDPVQLGDSVRGAFGIKTWSFDPDVQAGKEIRYKQYQAREIRTDISRTMRDQSLTPAQKQDKLEEQRKALSRLFPAEPVE